MSLAACMIAVRDVLQDLFRVDENSCEVGFDGKPKPACGERYFAVHSLGWNGINGDWDLGEEYTVGVTVTIRTGFAPKDRWGIAVWLAENDGMESTIRQVITAIHHNQTVRAAMDAVLDETGGGNFVTPLQLMRVDNPVVRNHTWFDADVPEDGAVAESGVSQTIVFGKCQRVQNIPDME